MPITGSLARAARALVQLPRAHVAQLAGLGEQVLAAFEAGNGDLDDEATARLHRALEDGGAAFLPEDTDGGIGVRLKFTGQDVRAINRMEGESGTVGEDDV